jgi:hypothetical protein
MNVQGLVLGYPCAPRSGPKAPQPAVCPAGCAIFGNYLPILKGLAQIGAWLRIIGGLDEVGASGSAEAPACVFLDN